MDGDSHKAGVRRGEAPAGPAAPERSDRMTRELTNLLDVSLRNVGTALRRVGESGEAAMDEATVRQLRDADWSLRRMAGLLTRWQRLDGRASQAELAGPSTTLAVVIDETVDCVRPLAEREGVAIGIELSRDASEAAAGRLQPVLMSGLEHAVRQAGPGGQVAIGAALTEGELEVTIRPESGDGAEAPETDGSPGAGDAAFAREPEAEPDGRADSSQAGVLATALCRDIVRAMNGVLHYDGAEGERDDQAAMLIRIPLGAG